MTVAPKITCFPFVILYSPISYFAKWRLFTSTLFPCLRYFCRSVEYDEQNRLCIISEEDSISQRDDLQTSSNPTHHLYDLVCLDNREYQKGRYHFRLDLFPFKDNETFFRNNFEYSSSFMTMCVGVFVTREVSKNKFNCNNVVTLIIMFPLMIEFLPESECNEHKWLVVLMINNEDDHEIQTGNYIFSHENAGIRNRSYHT